MTRCNGVFKGGGAKGIAYVGALEACEELGIEFDAVAGSSAGAITAALVACRFDSGELRRLMPSALATLQSPLRATLSVGRSALLDNRRLRSWLDVTISDRCRVLRPTSPATDCTFADLFAATGVDLYVVAMDLATRQPIVFSHDVTPTVPIADAVVASSAIPVAFAPSLVEVGGDIHRVVDGGAYANYPSFVFEDAAFRRYHGLEPTDDRVTLGFILDTVTAGGPARTGRPVDGPTFSSDRGSVARELGPLGAALGSGLLRWSLIAAPFLLGVAVMLWLIAEADRGFPILGALPRQIDELGDIVLVIGLLVAVVVSIVGVVSSVLLARLGKQLLDGGVMGAVAAMGVGPNVPYWVGGGGPASRHVAVRLTVPDGLTTLSFDVDASLVRLVIDQSSASARAQLAEVVGADPETRTAPAWDPPRHHELATADQHTTSGRLAALFRRLVGFGRRRGGRRMVSGLLGAYLGAAAAIVLVFGGFGSLLEGRILRGLGGLLAAGLLVLVGIAVAATYRHRSTRQPFPVLGRLGTSVLVVVVIGTLGLAAVLVGLTVTDDRIPTAVVSRADMVDVTVLHVDRSDEPVPLVWIQFDSGFDAALIDRLATDARGTPVTPCDDVDRQPDDELRGRIVAAAEQHAGLTDERCLVLDTDIVPNGLAPGSVETVRYDETERFVQLERLIWSTNYAFKPVGLSAGAIAFGLVAVQALRALRWRRHRRTGRRHVPAR